jgi:hypothetical protein
MELNAATRLKADAAAEWDTEVQISFTAKGEAQFIIPKMLAILAYLGSAGASRTITIEDVPASSQLGLEDGDMQFGFDGDGADKITDIMVDGKRFKLDGQGE